MWPTKVGPTSGPRIRPFQVTLPGDGAARSIGAADGVDEIIPLAQIIGAELHFQCGIGGAEKAVHIDLHFRRGNFAIREGYRVAEHGIVIIDARGYRDSAGGRG